MKHITEFLINTNKIQSDTKIPFSDLKAGDIIYSYSKIVNKSRILTIMQVNNFKREMIFICKEDDSNKYGVSIPRDVIDSYKYSNNDVLFYTTDEQTMKNFEAEQEV